jgi:hypothetical protein
MLSMAESTTFKLRQGLHTSTLRPKNNIRAVVEMSLQVSKDSPDAIKAFLEVANGTSKYLVVYASPRPTDGLSWCGDCRRAEPFINKKFSAHPEQVKVVYAGSEAEYVLCFSPRSY